MNPVIKYTLAECVGASCAAYCTAGFFGLNPVAATAATAAYVLSWRLGHAVVTGQIGDRRIIHCVVSPMLFGCGAAAILANKGS